MNSVDSGIPPGIEYRSSAHDVALRFATAHGPDVSDAQRRLFVTPGSLAATEIGEATTFYAEALVGDKPGRDLTEEEHATLAVLQTINSRLHGRDRPSKPHNVPATSTPEVAQQPGGPFRNSEAGLIIDAIRFTLMARAATSADAQDARIEEKKADIRRAEIAHSTTPYRLPEPPPELLRQPLQLKHWIASQEQQLAELERSKKDELATIKERDTRLAGILGDLGLSVRPHVRQAP